jgi:hypothetical protein
VTTLAIHNCEIFAPKEISASRQMIVVADGVISSIEASDRFSGGRSLGVFDVEGAIVTPGIVDTHVHLAFDGTADSVWKTDPAPAALATTCFHHANVNLRAGITTVREPGAQLFGVLAVRDANARFHLPAPRMLACGKAATFTRGHGWNSSIEADGPDAVRAAVRQIVKSGADCIKLYATGFPNVEPGGYAGYRMTPQDIAPAVDEAHQRKKLVAVHSCNEQSVLAGTRLAPTASSTASSSVTPPSSSWRSRAPHSAPLSRASTSSPPSPAPSLALRWRAPPRTSSPRAVSLGVNVILASDAACTAPASARTEREAFPAARHGPADRPLVRNRSRRPVHRAHRCRLHRGRHEGGHRRLAAEPYGETSLVVTAGRPYQL